MGRMRNQIANQSSGQEQQMQLICLAKIPRQGPRSTPFWTRFHLI